MTPVRDRLRHSPAVVKFYTVKLLLFIFPATYSLIFLPPFSFANGILSISITGCFAYSFSLNSTLKCLPQLSPNGCVYETFGITKRFPIKLQLFLIRAETLDKPLTAKCFIRVVRGWAFYS